MRYLDGGQISKHYEIALKNNAIGEMTNLSLNPDNVSSGQIENGLNNPLFRIIREESRLENSFYGV